MGLKRLESLGHFVSKDGVAPDDDKVCKKHNLLRPQTNELLQSFLGLSGYYRRMILQVAPVLLKPQFDWPLVLGTDASDCAVDAVLPQIGADGLGHPVLFSQ